MKNLFAKLLLSLLIFTIIIVSVIALVNRQLLVQDIKQRQDESRALIENHILSDMRMVDNAHAYFNRPYFKEMKKELLFLQNYYETNPDIYSWDIQEIHERTGMQLYIFDAQNKIVVSTYEPSIGLDLSECCERFASFLDKARQNEKFNSDGIENAEVTKDLWKYSFLPTKDRQYIIELGGELKDWPIFKIFNTFETSESLVAKYEDLNKIEIISDEGFFLQTKDDIKTIDELSPELMKVYQQATETDQPVEVMINLEDGRVDTHRFIPYHSLNEEGYSTKRIIYSQYSNRTELQLLNRNTQQFLMILAIGVATAGILLLIILKILKRTICLATFDPLTGVYNRSSYKQYMEQLIKKKRKEHIGLLLIDLDNFKQVNDQFGHLEGDEVLKKMADILRKAVGNKGFVARFGGDEFAIVVEDANEQGLHQLANDVLANVRKKQQDDSMWDLLTVSIGGTIQETPHESEVSLFMRSDEALYQSKNLGKDQYSFLSK
ncbi:MAG: GGDEF domain-containing protein [Solibacillus sp.]